MWNLLNFVDASRLVFKMLPMLKPRPYTIMVRNFRMRLFSRLMKAKFMQRSHMAHSCNKHEGKLTLCVVFNRAEFHSHFTANLSRKV